VPRPLTPVAEIVALAHAVADNVADEVADEVAEAEVDEDPDARSTNAHSAKMDNHISEASEKESRLQAILIPQGTTCGHATTADSQDTLKLTASTSNVPGINATRSTKAPHLPGLVQQEITT
jgi:hypothetical protein